MRAAIFLCSNETMTECYSLGLFGTNEPYGRHVLRGDLCFLYNYGDNRVYGVWNATTDGGTYNALAWHGRYPHQVRVSQVSERLMSVPRHQIQSLLGASEHIGCIIDGNYAQELLQHFSSVYHYEVVDGGRLRETEGDYRNRFPATYFCEDGHRVRSQGEKIIDDWLYRHSVRHGYEQIVPIPGRLIPDFVVYNRKDDPIYIEYWGLSGDAEYEERRLHKSKLYAQYKLPVLELYPGDIPIIESALPRKLSQVDVHFE